MKNKYVDVEIVFLTSAFLSSLLILSCDGEDEDWVTPGWPLIALCRSNRTILRGSLQQLLHLYVIGRTVLWSHTQCLLRHIYGLSMCTYLSLWCHDCWCDIGDIHLSRVAGVSLDLKTLTIATAGEKVSESLVVDLQESSFHFVLWAETRYWTSPTVKVHTLMTHLPSLVSELNGGLKHLFHSTGDHALSITLTLKQHSLFWALHCECLARAGL